MDRVGLGRALGFGARQAAKTLMKAADAVAAPSPGTKPAAEKGPNAGSAGRASVSPRAVVQPPSRVVSPRLQRAATKRRSSELRKAVWNPLATYTSVLWLEATGAFFGIFAMVLGTAAWRQRAAFVGIIRGQQATGDSRLFSLYALGCAVFVYFAVSNFVRAKRRERR